MLSRRTVLSSTLGGAIAIAADAQAKTPPAIAAGTGIAEADKAAAVYDRLYEEALDDSPELTTGLGLDKGARAAAKYKLDDRSDGVRLHELKLAEQQYAALQTLDRSKLSGVDAVNYDSIIYPYAAEIGALKQFVYGAPGYPAPYVVSQLTGAYHDIPDFLDSQHQIETKDDADAYLSRLNAFAKALDQETMRVKFDSGRGVTPPDFVLAGAIKQLKGLRDTPSSSSTLVQSLVRRAAEKKIAGDWSAHATKIYEGAIVAAVDRQIAALQALQPGAVHDAGVWRLPDGEAYYAFATRMQTTTNMSPDEIHKLGLDQAAIISAKMDAVLKSQGMTQGTVGERVSALMKDPKFIYPNTDEGKARLIADLNKKIEALYAKLPAYFGTLPKAKVEVRRVPKAIEAGAPGGYYNGPSLDGTRPGAYYINLRDSAEVPSFTLPTLTYHESVPGHHLQISLAQEAKALPRIRQIGGYNAYVEGWALYAEQFADEIGMYDGDPFGKVGYLKDQLFRAGRLVVDSGLHAKRWSREQAIAYMVETTGDTQTAMATEIERYCVWPGQACGYMVGRLTWLRERDYAKAQLGPKFDIKKFHDAGLLSGAMPLDVLDRVIKAYVAQTLAS